MFKLIGIFTLITVSAARPGLLEAQTSLQTIGSIINHIPTAITHQSKTEIHSQQPLISSIISPVLSSIPAQSILQETVSPIILSQIQSSSLLEGQGQTLAGQDTIIGDEGSLLGDQASIHQSQGSLIGGQNIVVGGQSGLIESEASSIINNQNAIIGNLGLSADSISSAGLKLNSINGLSH